MKSFPLIHSSSSTYKFIKPLSLQQLMLKLHVRPYRSTHFESTCLHGKSRLMDPSLPLSCMMLCSNIYYKSYTFDKPNKKANTPQERGRANSSGWIAHLHLKDKGRSFEDSVKSFLSLGYCGKYSLQTLIHTLVKQSTPSWNKWLWYLPWWAPPIPWFLLAFD